MKKVFITGFLVFALINILAVSAFAASSVPEGGTEPNWTYTATLDGTDAATTTTIDAGDMFLLIVIKTSALNAGGFPASLTADSILYIDQKTATADDQSSNTITFSGFIPMNYSGGKAFISGGNLAAPVAVGTLDSHGIWGDVNNDVLVNATDAVLTLRHSSGIITLGADAVALGNVNGDGSLNATDAVLILRRSSGIISVFPVE
jgi:hypothetical protein